MKKAFSSAIVILLTLAIIASSACGSTSSKEETPSPIIDTISELEGYYKNSIYGFSLSYPPEWIAQEGGPNDPAFTTHNSNNSCMVQVFVEPLLQTISTSDYSAEAMEVIKQKLVYFEMLSEGEVELDGETGYWYIFSGNESNTSLTSTLLSVVHGSQAFLILSACESEIYELLQETIESIVFSFRLQEPISLENALVLYDTGPSTLDPAVTRDTTSASYVLEIFSGLVTLDQELQVVPDIAEWDISNDGKTYTFFLRQDVTFQDGSSITANDFKYSLERVCDPATNSQTAATYLGDIVGVDAKLAGEASEISGIEVIDDYTLQITIDAPKAYFLSKLAYPTAFVVDQANVNSGDDWWRHPNGSGPFTLSQWEEDELLILERNNLYYGEMPQIETVAFRLWSGVPMIMYETGEIDISYVSASNIERVLDPFNPLNKELVKTPEFSLWFIGFNTQKPPFDDPKVRQAFSHAVDKDRIIELLFNDMVTRADGILPPGMPGYNEQLNALEFDPEKAKEMIEQSTYGNTANLPPLTFTTSGRGQVSPVHEAIIGMWQQYLGANVSIRQIEPEAYIYTLKEEKDELYDIGWVADYADPQNFLEILFHSDAEDNTGEYSNPQIDALLEAAGKEMNPETRLNMYQQIEQMLVDDAASLPLYFGIDYKLVKPYVKGYVATPLPIPWLKYISIEPHE